MSDELREALDRLPRLRITGEQLDAIDPDPEKVVYTDWDEWDEYVRLDAVRAALAARPDSPTLDEWGPSIAANPVFVHNHGPYEGPGVACPEQLIGACQLARLAAEAPERPAPETRKQRERDLMASNHAIGRHRGGRPVQGCPLCEVSA